MRTPIRLIIVALCFVLGACATPQSALDQANNGAMLIAALQIELREFRLVQASVAKGRIDSVRRQDALLATYDADAAFEERVQRAAGRDDQLRLYATLRDLADSRAKDEAGLQAKLAEFEAAYAKLLLPLPDPGNKLGIAQQTIAVMGEELSLQERAKMAADFAKEIKKSIDENRKRIADAAATAKSEAPKTQVAAPAAPTK